MFTEFILLYKVNAVYLHCVYPFIRPKKDNFNISHSKFLYLRWVEMLEWIYLLQNRIYFVLF
jgi:hypothetical protein